MSGVLPPEPAAPPADPGRRETALVRFPIAVEEIEAGLVARLDPTILSSDDRVCNTQDPPVSRPGLFICIETLGSTTTWAGVTTGARSERLELQELWRSGGFKRWRFGPQYLTDGASLWRGPSEVFAEASWEEVSASGGRHRARISPEGLAAVRREVDRQRHRRHRP